MFEITKEFVEKLGINIKIEDSPPRHNLWMDCSKAKAKVSYLVMFQMHYIMVVPNLG